MLIGRTVDEVLSELTTAADVNVGQSAQEICPLGVLAPIGENDIHELIDPGRLRAGSVSLRNDQVRNRGDGCVLVGVKSLQRRGGWHLFMHLAKQAEHIPR